MSVYTLGANIYPLNSAPSAGQLNISMTRINSCVRSKYSYRLPVKRLKIHLNKIVRILDILASFSVSVRNLKAAGLLLSSSYVSTSSGDDIKYEVEVWIYETMEPWTCTSPMR